MAGSTLDLIARYKFIYLLVSLLFLFLIHPLSQPFVGARIVMHILSSLVLCTAIYAVSQGRKVLVIGVTLLIPALLGTWFGYVTDHPTFHMMALSFTILFFSTQSRVAPPTSSFPIIRILSGLDCFIFFGTQTKNMDQFHMIHFSFKTKIILQFNFLFIILHYF